LSEIDFINANGEVMDNICTLVGINAIKIKLFLKDL